MIGHRVKNVRMWLLAIVLVVAAIPVEAEPGDRTELPRFPVAIKSCDRPLTFARPPARTMVYGANLTEMMLALGLEERIGRVVSVRPLEVNAIALRFPAIKHLSVSDAAPTFEHILESETDLLFAGWHAGLKPGGDISPANLAGFGVPVYEATETCTYVGSNAYPTLDYLFRDLRALAAIFGVPERAERLIEGYAERLSRVRAAINGRTARSVFIYSAGDRLAFSAGGMSTLQAIIDAAGGENVSAGVKSSWLYMSWETVIERNSDAIVMVEYDLSRTGQRIAFLSSRTGLDKLDAVKNRKFVVLPYHTTVPSPFNIDAVEIVARALHPEAFAEVNDKDAARSPESKP